jgi:hypothetical protein
MDRMTKWRPFLALGALLCFIASCTLRVERIKAYGIKDQRFDFDYDIGSWQDSVFLFCCNGTISTPRGEFEKGEYQVILTARGTQAAGVYPTAKVLLNHKNLRELHLDSSFSTYRVPFTLETKTIISIQLLFDQDGVDEKGNDRNIYIRNMAVDTVGH